MTTGNHSAPHCEGSGPIEGMSEWASWYRINRKDDGTFEAELDEAWWWGGGHNDGGTMRAEVPEEWMELPYDKFLENLVTLVRAEHYGFIAESLKRKKGLREFLGYRRRSCQPGRQGLPRAGQNPLQSEFLILFNLVPPQI